MKGREFFLLLQNPGRKVSRQTESDKPTPGAPGRGGSEEGRRRVRGGTGVLGKCSFFRQCFSRHWESAHSELRDPACFPTQTGELLHPGERWRIPLKKQTAARSEGCHTVSTQLFGTSLSYMKSQPSSDIRRSLGREEKDQNIQISGKKKGGKSKKCSRWEKTSRDQGLNPQG